MSEKRKAAVIGGFVADALSLGVHWVYNTRVIDKKFGRVDRFFDPLTSYHEGKVAGDFTHYGDQMLVLLEAVSPSRGYDSVRFAEMWKDFFATYKGYFDKATKATLANMEAGRGLTESGSDSDDLAGASRLSAAQVSCVHLTRASWPADSVWDRPSRPSETWRSQAIAVSISGCGMRAGI